MPRKPVRRAAELRSERSNKGKKFPAEPLTADEVAALMRVCSRRAPTGIRDRALIALMWRTCLRISEALALKVSDLNLAAGQLTVLHGKGDKRRVVAIDQDAAAHLTVWLQKRKEIRLSGHRPIFCTLKGAQLSTAQVRGMLRRRKAKVNKNHKKQPDKWVAIAKRVHCHGLRHTGASDMVAEGFALLDIQAQLGHTSAATTAKYLHHLNPVERIARLSARSWPKGASHEDTSLESDTSLEP